MVKTILNYGEAGGLHVVFNSGLTFLFFSQYSHHLLFSGMYTLQKKKKKKKTLFENE